MSSFSRDQGQYDWNVLNLTRTTVNHTLIQAVIKKKKATQIKSI